MLKNTFVKLLAATALAAAATGVASDDIDSAPIHYSAAPVDDAITRLQRELDTGGVVLEWDDRRGWLPSVLERLGIGHASQTLVFSKTSLQAHMISPRTPRALYYNDDAYVGWTPRAELIELTAIDPVQGPIFYTIQQTKTDRPRFLRDTGDCLACHQSSRTRDVPGLFVRSVFPNSRGHALLSLGSKTTDPSTPFGVRYGGWYVTGDTGGIPHRGNRLFSEADETTAGSAIDLGSTSRLKDYPTPHSDLIALMVLEHQAQMHNAITYASYEARRAAHYDTMWNEILKKADGHRFDVSVRRLDRAADELLACLLFSGEHPLEKPIAGSSEFSKEFSAAGRRDAKGRSLRDFDLRTRLFRYPCSYLIHSESYAALPETIRSRVAARLDRVLDGSNHSPEFSHLSADDRRDLREILDATTEPSVVGDAPRAESAGL